MSSQVSKNFAPYFCLYRGLIVLMAYYRQRSCIGELMMNFKIEIFFITIVIVYGLFVVNDIVYYCNDTYD